MRRLTRAVVAPLFARSAGALRSPRAASACCGPRGSGSSVCVYDAHRLSLGTTLTRERYLAHDHVLVSYNGDLRGIVEDLSGVQRRVRVSMPGFGSVGPALEALG